MAALLAAKGHGFQCRISPVIRVGAGALPPILLSVDAPDTRAANFPSLVSTSSTSGEPATLDAQPRHEGAGGRRGQGEAQRIVVLPEVDHAAAVERQSLDDAAGCPLAEAGDLRFAGRPVEQEEVEPAAARRDA